MDTDLPVVEPVVQATEVMDTDVAVIPEPAMAVPAPALVEQEQSQVLVHADRGYPSLYDDKASTIVAILLGMSIVGGIQVVVWQIHQKAKSEYRALTQFVTMMVALVLGAYMADLLIAGPDTSLLSDDEHTVILGFVKDICLMVFSYYFGTRSAGKAES